MPEIDRTPLRPIAPVGGHWLAGSAAEMRKSPHRFPARIAHAGGGMARFRILNRSFVACASVEAMRQVLVQKHANFPRSFHARNAALVIGNGLICNEGEDWLVRRRQVLPAFKKESLLSVTALAVDETRTLLDKWATLKRDAKPVDALAHAQSLTLSVIHHALFSARITDDESERLSNAVRNAVRAVRMRNVSPIAAPLWLPTRNNRSLAHIRTTLDDFMEQRIRAREAVPETAWPADILTLLLRASDPESGAKLGRDALRDELKTLFVAGFETTASALTWCLYLLARHPQVAARWRAEVDSVLAGNAPDSDAIARLPFCAAIVHEAMRLYPPVYNMGRVALADDEIDGRAVRRGDILLLSIFGVHRNPAEWEAPDEFRPDRFLPGASWNKLAFMPFAVGKHQCIGNTFALIELMVALAMIAQRFEIAVPPNFEVGENAFITLTPDKLIPLQLTPRT